MSEKHTHWFNPQNDLALANGSAYFTAPKSATDLCLSGACLPMWYGRPGDSFIGAVNRQWYESICRTFGIEVTPCMAPLPDVPPQPWGWSAAARRYLQNFGYAPESLPTSERVSQWRQLSGRITTAVLIGELMTRHPEMMLDYTQKGKPFIARTFDEAMSHITGLNVAMLKLPWSGSGRGQQVTDRTTSDELHRRVKGMLSRQGAIEITPYYDKILDFAMLWEDNRFVGYSCFETDTHGGWLHNNLLSDADIERKILKALGRPLDIEPIRNTLSELISKLFAQYSYRGPAGVDFIVGNIHGSENITDMPRLLVPVEVNVRRTMGHIAHRLYSSFVGLGNSGRFMIRPAEYLNEPYHIPDADPGMVIEGSRLLDGSLDLVPPGGNFRFILRSFEGQLG